jgi:glucose/arabinose dehydrogenase
LLQEPPWHLLALRSARLGYTVTAFTKKEWPIITLGFLAFLWAISTSLLLFPYYSNDHDEPVYVLQAQTLLQGKLFLPADEFSKFFRPFFFINDGERIFSKYPPVYPALLALGQLLFGSMRVTLGLVAAATVIAFYLLAQELYPDRRTALKSAVVLLLSPFFLIQSATFLPYTTSLMLSLVFAFLLLRGSRTGSAVVLALSGVVLGLAFFHRPYDALLFAVPFGLVLLKFHWNNLGQLFRRGAWISAGFAPLLGLTLGYNALMTGDPFLFPHSFYEPLDQLGFGLRRMHPSHSPMPYGIEHGLSALWDHFRQLSFWVFGGPIVVGLAFLRLMLPPFRWQEGLLFLLLLSIPLGYVFFWGTYVAATTWGGISYVGPFYYISLMAPVVLLGVQGPIRISRWRPIAAVALVLAMVAVDFWLVISHISTNYEYSQENRAIYEPLRQHRINNGLVFVPPIYGPFLLHPFAALANGPSLDGPVLYAVERGEQNFDLMDQYPNRQPYKFIYQGLYTEGPDDRFETALLPLQRIHVPELTQSLRIINPTDKPFVYAYIWNDERTETYLLDDSSRKGNIYNLQWTITPEQISFEGPRIGRPLSEIDSLSDSQPLAVAIAFTDSLDREPQVIVERRFTFRLTSDNQMEIILPPEEWYNPDWPDSEWVMGNIDSVMGDAVSASSDGVTLVGNNQKVTVVAPIADFKASPVSIAEAPDGRLFYNELKTGNVRIIENGKLQEEPFATVDVATFGESGLLGLALDPDFSTNGYVYVLRTVPDGVAGRPVKQEVIRFTDQNGKGVDPTIIIEDLPATKNNVHNGGRLEFGPDGKLWVTIGDGNSGPGNQRDPQDPSSYYGKVLRFNSDGSIPLDNPIPNSAVYAKGFRNPFGMAFHPITGDLFVSENGPMDSDEINIVVPSGNYGWRDVRGVAKKPNRFVDPVYVWEKPIAPTGLAFRPQDPNTLFVCNAILGELRALTLGPQYDTVVGEEFIAKGCHLDVEVSNNGDLYISGFDSIRRVRVDGEPGQSLSAGPSN